VDAEHRHELKENDLAESLRNFSTFWQNWGNSLLMAVLVGLLALLAYQFFTNRAARAHEDSWSALVQETSPAGLRAIAETNSDPAVQALARLQAAELLLLKIAEPASATQPSTAGQIEEAQSLLKTVADQPGLSPVYRLNALLGLAAVAEDQGQWDEAAQIYQQISQESGSRFAAIASRADQRRQLLDQLAQPVAFAASTQPADPRPAAAAEPAALPEPLP
jgi:predicted negative regulator of RcsB-dependent stress response